VIGGGHVADRGGAPYHPDVITVASRPGPLEIDEARAVVLVIDMQNDFGARGGMFDRAGIDITGITAAAETTGPVLAAARDAGMPIVYVKMEHPDDLSNVGPEDGPHWIKHLPLRLGEEVVAPNGSTSRILVKDTWNTQILDELEPQPADLVVSKHRFSGFFETELDDVLRGMNAKYLIVTGCTTSICVESTVRDAMFRDYACLVLEDCTAEPIGSDLPRTNHEASLLNIEMLFGWVSDSAEVIDALARSAKLISTS
jgi:ureidoacrylate peracid hydrolase